MGTLESITLWFGIGLMITGMLTVTITLFVVAIKAMANRRWEYGAVLGFGGGVVFWTMLATLSIALGGG